MAPKRGIAAVKKPSQGDKYIFLDSDDNEIGTHDSANICLRRGASSADGESTRAAEPRSRVPIVARNLSTEPSSATPQAHPGFTSRQDLLNHDCEQSNSHYKLERTLFDLNQTAPPQPDQPVPTAEPAECPPPNEHPQPKRTKFSARQQLTPKRQLAPHSSSSSAATTLSGQLETLSLSPPDTTAAMSKAYIPPNQHKNMRACMVCSVVRTQQQFYSGGCPNCEAFMELAGNHDAIQDCTSQVFDGLITVSDTRKSWVARWQRLEGYVPGVYAVQVEGVLPEEIIAAAENAGVHYVPRDGSVNEALPTDA